jgi:hypothetical protein
LRCDQQIRSAGIGLEHLNRVASGTSQLDGEVVSLPCARRKAITDAQQRSALRLRKSAVRKVASSNAWRDTTSSLT